MYSWKVRYVAKGCSRKVAGACARYLVLDDDVTSAFYGFLLQYSITIYLEWYGKHLDFLKSMSFDHSMCELWFIMYNWCR